jgi:nucleoside-diphosphate-sugar epimerase
MANLLVTGATGFLGEHLCRVLVEQGHTVRGLARSRSGVLADLGIEHVRGDVLNLGDLEQALAGVHAVFHLGAPSPATRTTRSG